MSESKEHIDNVEAWAEIVEDVLWPIHDWEGKIAILELAIRNARAKQSGSHSLATYWRNGRAGGES
jgi:hypothetical protein